VNDLKLPWFVCGNVQMSRIRIVLTHLKLATLVTEERTWKEGLCYTATDARLLLSILPGKTLASKSQKLKPITATLLLDGS
jgi:hypothetical protein